MAERSVLAELDPERVAVGAVDAPRDLDGLLPHERTPGVTAAGLTSILPLTGWDALMGFRLDGPTGQVEAQAGVRTVSPGYLEALGLRLAEGRWFTDADTTSSDPVVVVNRAFVTTYIPDGALGKRLPVTLEDDGPTGYTIAGVIEDVLPSTRDERPRPEIYGSLLQLRAGVRFEEPTIVVRTSGDPEALAAAVRHMVADLDRGAIVDQVVTMEDRLRTGLARPHATPASATRRPAHQQRRIPCVRSRCATCRSTSA